MSSLFQSIIKRIQSWFGGKAESSILASNSGKPTAEKKPTAGGKTNVAKVVEKTARFEDFHLDERLMQAIGDMRFVAPRPIQAQIIPLAIEGKDVLGLAQTGTGKTASFVIPIIQRLLKFPGDGIRALILTPTRELAQQIDEHVQALGYHGGVSSVSIVGGVDYGPQEEALRKGAPIIVATPGRLIDHMKKSIGDFSKVEMLVIDEADRLYDMGFFPDIQTIISLLPPKRQSMLFSATMPDPIRKLVEKTLCRPVQISVGHNEASGSVEQVAFLVDLRDKSSLLLKMLRDPDLESVIVFTNTQKTTQMLSNFLIRKGINAQCLHGGKTQEERTETLNRFRSGSLKILVATDVAARGIDVVGVTHVINYDIPHSTDEYIHRIGRTGRSEELGHAFTLVAGTEVQVWKRFSSGLKSKVEIQETSFFSGERQPERLAGRNGERNGKPHGSGPRKRTFHRDRGRKS